MDHFILPWQESHKYLQFSSPVFVCENSRLKEFRNLLNITQPEEGDSNSGLSHSRTHTSVIFLAKSPVLAPRKPS